MYDINDPKWRSSKAGRAAYATYVRGIEKKEAPQEIVDEFHRGNKGDMFKIWAKNGGDWLETCYVTGLKTRTINSTDSVHKLWSKAEIQRSSF